jgi:GNAT superfamily N-acetyltransferase
MKIAPARPAQLDRLVAIYSACKRELQEQCNDQWTEEYPNAEITAEDIAAGTLFVAMNGDLPVGAINLSPDDEPECEIVDWTDRSGRFLVASRLAVWLNMQKQGLGTALMHFADDFARENGYTSMRLLVYEKSGDLIRYYEKLGYERRKGDVWFPGRQHPFLAYEKQLM